MIWRLAFFTQNNYNDNNYAGCQTCIGVNLRIEMDEARANWPVDADSECCFIVTDPDENKILYLIAENSKLAQYVHEKMVLLF